MNVLSMRTIQAVLRLVLICSSLTAAWAQTAISRIVSAANTFLSTLDEKQRQKVLFAFDDDKQRARWSNFPTSFVPRMSCLPESSGKTSMASRFPLASQLRRAEAKLAVSPIRVEPHRSSARCESRPSAAGSFHAQPPE